MASSPTVTVIVPTYNRAHLVSRAIRSVLAQTFQDWELEVVDDGSTDNTSTVVEAFRDDRIHYLKLEVNRGAPAARNTGLRAARGAYLAFLDDDDVWLPMKLERQVEALQTTILPNVGAVHCGVLLFSDQGERQLDLDGIRGDIYEQVLARSLPIGVGSSLVVRRAVLEAGILFDEALPDFGDWDYLLRVSRQYQVEYVPEPLVRLRPGLSNGAHVFQRSNVLRGWEMVLEKYADELQRRPRIRAYYHGIAAIYSYIQGDWRKLRRFLRTAIRVQPQNPQYWAWLLGSYFGRYGFRAALKLLPRQRLEV